MTLGINASRISSLKAKIAAQLEGSTKPIALILTASGDEGGLFREDRGYHKSNRSKLIDEGYQLIEIDNIDDPKMLAQACADIPTSRIALTLIRAHGQPTKMAFSESCVVNSNEVAAVFGWLKDKLKDDAIIILESCFTGKLIDNFLDNMQFAFTKLTQEKKDIIIAAPSDGSFDITFDIKEKAFNFYSRSSPYTSDNSSIIINKEIKSILKMQDELDPEKLKQALLPLLRTKRPIFIINRAVESYLHQSGFSHSGGLMIAIANTDYNAIKTLIEVFKANLDYGSPSNISNSPEYQCPLSAAIEKKDNNIIRYLLGKGADIFIQHHGITPLDFLMEKCQKMKKDNSDLASDLLETFEKFIQHLETHSPTKLQGHEREVENFRKFKLEFDADPSSSPRFRRK